MTVRKFMLKKFPTNKYIDCPIPKHHWATIEEYAKLYHESETKKMDIALKDGLPTHTIDITGRRILLGDKVTYDFPEESSSFQVIFENNAFRKKYHGWDKTLEKPILEFGEMAKQMRLKVIRLNKIK